MKMKFAAPLVVLGSVLWFVPERPIQMLNAMSVMLKAAGPGTLPVSPPAPLEEDAVSETRP
jgi:hypothetical protein